MSETLLRKKMLYRSGVEYADYAVNIAQGCSHGCAYPCYAYLMARRFGIVKNMDEWTSPVPVANACEILGNELASLQKKNRLPENIHFCFTTDPFMYGHPEISLASLQCIRLCNEYGVPVTVLTKGVLPEILGSKEFLSENRYGITLVSSSEEFRRKYEPGAAPVRERIEGMYRLEAAGKRIWVSMEPYPTPEMADRTEEEMTENLADLIRTVSAGTIEKIIFGRIHYRRSSSSERKIKEYYRSCVSVAEKTCGDLKIPLIVKKGTAPV